MIRWSRGKLVQTRNIAHLKDYNLQSQTTRLFIYTRRGNFYKISTRTGMGTDVPCDNQGKTIQGGTNKKTADGVRPASGD